MNTTTQPAAASAHDGGTKPATLTRCRQDRMLAGVASGLGAHLGVDAIIVRIAFVALTLIGGAGIPLYLACWLLIPDEGATRSIAAGVVSDLHRPG